MAKARLDRHAGGAMSYIMAYVNSSNWYDIGAAFETPDPSPAPALGPIRYAFPPAHP